MLRRISSLHKVGTRPVSTTVGNQNLFKNFQEALKKESQKEGIDDELKKLQKQVMEDQKKFAESEKYKKLKKYDSQFISFK